MDVEGVDWRVVKAALLRRKQADFTLDLEEICKKHGVVLRAIIVPSPDGQFAQAQIQVDLAE